MLPILSQLAPDEVVIRQFVIDVIGADIHIAAIVPDGAIAGAYFGGDVEAAVDWAVKFNVPGRNIYWTANRCDEEVGCKPSKEEITLARYAHVDIDPPKDGSPFDKAAVIRKLEACRVRTGSRQAAARDVCQPWDTAAYQAIPNVSILFVQRHKSGHPTRTIVYIEETWVPYDEYGGCPRVGCLW